MITSPLLPKMWWSFEVLEEVSDITLNLIEKIASKPVKVSIFQKQLCLLLELGPHLSVRKIITTCLKILVIFYRLHYSAAWCYFKTFQNFLIVEREIEFDTIFIIKAKFSLPPLLWWKLLAFYLFGSRSLPTLYTRHKGTESLLF